MTDTKETPVKTDDASDTADNNASLNKPNTTKRDDAKYLRPARFGAYSYPTYRFEKDGKDRTKLAVGDKFTFMASGRKHTGEVKALTDNPLDVVFCNIRIT